MKRFKFLIIIIFAHILTFFCFKSNAVEGKIDIKTKEQAQQKFYEAKAREEELRRKVDKLKEDRDIAERNKRLLEAKKAKLEKAGEDTTVTQQSITRQQEKLNQVQSQFAEAQQELVTIEAIVNQLGSVLTAPSPTPRIQWDVQQLEKRVTNLDSLQQVYREIMQYADDYKIQLQALKRLNDIAKNLRDKEIDTFQKDVMQKRIDELENFNTYKQLPAVNDFEKKLALDKKIPSDRIAAVVQEVSDLSSHVNQEAITLGALKDLLKQFDQASASIKYYGLDKLNASLQELIDLNRGQLKAKILVLERPKPQDIKLEDLAEGGVLDDLSNTQGVFAQDIETVKPEQQRSFFASVSDLMPYSGEEIISGLTSAVQKSARAVHSTLGKMADVGSKIEKVPQVTATAGKTVQTIQDSKMLAVAGAVPGVRGYADKATNVLSKVSGALENPWTQAIVGGVAYAGRLVRTAAEQLQNVAVAIDEATIPELTKVTELIAQEEARIASQIKPEVTPEQKTVWQRIIDSITNFFKSIKETIFPSKTPLVAARDKYDATRESFFKFLDLPPDASDKQIKNALEAEATKYKDPELLARYAKPYMQASKDLATVIAAEAEKLQGVYENFEFLVKAWGESTPEKKESLIDAVKDLFKLRDAKITLLRELKNSVQKLNEDAKTFAGPQKDLAQDLIDKMSILVNGSLIDEITAFDKGLKMVQDSLKARIDQLQGKSTTEVPGGGY